jgi:CRISPR-associated protein Cas1
VESIRGVEGQAAAVAFAVFSLHLTPAVRPLFPFTTRNRRPPRDAMNCLLSFLYALLRHDCIAALTAVGLDPFVGFLHAHRANRESLALDLMEEFRPLADRVAITLLNRGELKPESFSQREGGAVELTEKGRRTIVTAWKERKLEETTHPAFQQKCRVGQLFHLQSRVLTRAIRAEAPGYLPYLGQ